MTVREMIKLLIDVEVDTDDLKLLRESPENHITDKRDLTKLEQLFSLIDEAIKMEEK